MNEGSQGPPHNGKGRGFSEWSAEETQAQRAARLEVMAIPTFPDLERRLIGVFGATPEAIVLHQLIYWFSKKKMADRWTLFKTHAEWQAERGLSRRQVEKARQRLKPTGLVEECKGPFKKVHFRVDWARLLEVLRTGRLYPLNPVQSPIVPPQTGDTADSHTGKTPEQGGDNRDCTP